MARTTVADLEARLEAMQEEIDSLRAHIDAQASAPTIQYVRELKPPALLPGRLDFHEMSLELSGEYAGYDETRDVWGANQYL